ITSGDGVVVGRVLVPASRRPDADRLAAVASADTSDQPTRRTRRRADAEPRQNAGDADGELSVPLAVIENGDAITKNAPECAAGDACAARGAGKDGCLSHCRPPPSARPPRRLRL